VAFSNGDGTWRVTNQNVPDFGAWAAEPNVKVLTGDFNGVAAHRSDGRCWLGRRSDGVNVIFKVRQFC
jgi:hypothetical protein